MECYICSEANPNLCLTVSGDSKKTEARIILDEISGKPGQLWKIEGATITSVLSGYDLDIYGGARSGHDLIQFERRENQDNQKFYFHSDGSIRLMNGMCLDINQGKIRKGTKIIAYAFHNQKNQKWRIVTAV